MVYFNMTILREKNSMHLARLVIFSLVYALLISYCISVFATVQKLYPTQSKTHVEQLKIENS